MFFSRGYGGPNWAFSHFLNPYFWCKTPPCTLPENSCTISASFSTVLRTKSALETSKWKIGPKAPCWTHSGLTFHLLVSKADLARKTIENGAPNSLRNEHTDWTEFAPAHLEGRFSSQNPGKWCTNFVLHSQRFARMSCQRAGLVVSPTSFHSWH